MGYMIAGTALAALGLGLILGAAYISRRSARERDARILADLRGRRDMRALRGELREVLRAVRRLEDREKALSEAAEQRAEELEQSGLTLDVMLAGVDVLLKRQRAADERLERMEKRLTGRSAFAERADPTEQSGRGGEELPAAKLSEISDREMEEGVMNLLRYAAGKVPGVEIST